MGVTTPSTHWAFLISNLLVDITMIKQDLASKAGSAAQEGRKLITLVPSYLARQGYEFVFEGNAGPACEKCRVREVCLTNLEVGVRYSVKQLKSAEHYCGLVDAKATVVEVERARPRLTIEKQKYIPSASIKYSPIPCNWKFCPNYIYCVDNGVPEGSKVRLEREEGDVDCPRGFRLAFVAVSLP